MHPDEIAHMEFAAAMRGFDRDEVVAYLQQVAEHVRALEAQVAAPAAPAPTVDLESQIGAEVAEILRSARAAAEQTGAEADRTLAAARAEAEQVTSAARSEAARLVEHARKTADDLVRQARAEADDVLQDAATRQERAEAANHAALGALGQVDRQLAELRAALDAAVARSDGAAAALRGEAPAVEAVPA